MFKLKNKSLSALVLHFTSTLFSFFKSVKSRQIQIEHENSLRESQSLAYSTDLKTALRLKIESDQRSQLFAQVAPVGIYYTDPKGNCQYINEKACEITGLTKDNALGSGWGQSLHPDDRGKVINHWVNSFQNTQIFEMEYRFLKPDGDIRWVAGRALEMRDGEGVLLGYVGALTDITGNKKIENELVESKKAAETATRTKSEFLANMSHEIRTPMNAIIGFTEVALDEPCSPDTRRYLEKIQFASNSLMLILNDILDFSKIESGKIEIANEFFSLEDIQNNLYKLFQNIAQKQNLDFRINIDSRIPLTLIGDAFRIQQVLTNLLGNGFKFTQRGKVSLNCSLVGFDEHRVDVLFEVQDTGIGIAESDLPKLFKAFSQVDGSITRKYGGTGLGLAICNKLLALMGSRLNISNQHQLGTTFRFELNLAFSTQNSTKTTEELSKYQGPTKSLISSELLQRIKSIMPFQVLIVEDNPANKFLVEKYFEIFGISFMTADDGLKALTLVAHRRFDLILMDVQMPIMDGLETTRRIRKIENYADIPIIALSAGVTPSERNLCLKTGMNDFVDKPLNIENLFAVIAEQLDRHRAVSKPVNSENYF
jgi:PAS domain S-box-containing protein